MVRAGKACHCSAVIQTQQVCQTIKAASRTSIALSRYYVLHSNHNRTRTDLYLHTPLFSFKPNFLHCHSPRKDESKMCVCAPVLLLTFNWFSQEREGCRSKKVLSTALKESSLANVLQPRSSGRKIQSCSFKKKYAKRTQEEVLGGGRRDSIALVRAGIARHCSTVAQTHQACQTITTSIPTNIFTLLRATAARTRTELFYFFQKKDSTKLAAPVLINNVGRLLECSYSIYICTERTSIPSKVARVYCPSKVPPGTFTSRAFFASAIPLYVHVQR